MKAEVRLASESDAPLCTEWILHTPDNLLDPEVANYPNLRTLAIDLAGQPSLYAPFHPVYMVESLAHRPDITAKENAYALRKFQNALEELAKAYGIREVYWMCKDESLIAFAERHGYEVVKYKMLRKKVEV